MYRKILVPLDGSKLAECALEHVRVVAKGCNVPEVILLTVVSPPYFTGGTDDVFPADMLREEMEGYRTRAKEYLDKTVKGLQKEGVAAESVILEGYVAESILDYAEKKDIDLIIMATHGRSGVVRWALGSVADRVIRHSKVPVMAVSPSGFRGVGNRKAILAPRKSENLGGKK